MIESVHLSSIGLVHCVAFVRCQEPFIDLGVDPVRHLQCQDVLSFVDVFVCLCYRRKFLFVLLTFGPAFLRPASCAGNPLQIDGNLTDAARPPRSSTMSLRAQMSEVRTLSCMLIRFGLPR